MADEKLKNELMKDEELEDVAGGTVTEFGEICGAMANNFALSNLLKGSSHLPVGNLVQREIVVAILKNKMGIEADVSLGLLGTGIGSENNTYKDLCNDGKPMTHDEVLNRIKTYAF